ncbi:MAG: zinc-ribbon domain-containing protein [Methanosarcinales archaeon]|nr:zinc-ribbon domain-containing protein [Methanosarcinales archaeon]
MNIKDSIVQKTQIGNIFCSKCGTRLQLKERFCTNCGAEIFER